MAGGEHNLKWQAPARAPERRSTDWYWALGLLALCGAILSFLVGNLLFSAIIVIAAAMIGISASRVPRMHTIEIGAQGITADQEFYPFASLEAFWIEDREPPRLYLETSSVLHRHLMFVLPSIEHAREVQSLLSGRVHEEVRHTPSTALAEFLGL